MTVFSFMNKDIIGPPTFSLRLLCFGVYAGNHIIFQTMAIFPGKCVWFLCCGSPFLKTGFV